MPTRRLKTLALGGSINLHKDARPEVSSGAERLDHDPTFDASLCLLFPCFRLGVQSLCRHKCYPVVTLSLCRHSADAIIGYSDIV